MTGPLRALIGNQRLDKVDDLLLTGCCGVEFAAHFGEALIDVRPKVDEVGSEIHEVFAEGVEADRSRLPKVAEFVVECGHVAVGGSGEDASGSCVLLTCSYSPGQVVHLSFQSGDACFKVPRLHSGEPTVGYRRCRSVTNRGYPFAAKPASRCRSVAKGRIERTEPDM